MNGRIQNQIKAVIFDMDGVLLDSEAVYEEGWRIAGEKKNLRGIDAFHKTILGLSEQDTIAAKSFMVRILTARNFGISLRKFRLKL